MVQKVWSVNVDDSSSAMQLKRWSLSSINSHWQWLWSWSRKSAMLEKELVVQVPEQMWNWPRRQRVRDEPNVKSRDDCVPNALGSEPSRSLQVCWCWSARRSCRTEHHLCPQAEESMLGWRPDSPVRIAGDHLKVTGLSSTCSCQHLWNFNLLRFLLLIKFLVLILEVYFSFDLTLILFFWGQMSEKVQSLPTFVLFKPRNTDVPTEETWHCFR